MQHQTQNCEIRSNGVPPCASDKSHLATTLNMIVLRRAVKNKVILDGRNLSISELCAVSWDTDIHVAVDDCCMSEVRENALYLTERIKNGLVVYGVNTGFGGSADVRCNDTVAVQDALIRHLKAGFGEVFDSAVTRGVMLIRANSLSRARSGVQPEAIQQLCALLNNDVVPLVPKRGSISASGDLMPTSYVAAAMAGWPSCKVLHRGSLTTADEALNSSQLKPLTFMNKDALAVVNSSSFAASFAAQALYSANTAALLTEAAVALSVEALSGHLESFHPIIHECMPHAGQQEVAANIRDLLSKSQLAITHLDMDHPDTAGALKQDRYALRTAAQWLAPAIDMLHRAVITVNTDLNASNDNPIVDHLQEKILHGGNFQGTSVAVAMDNTRQAVQLCGKLMFAQLSEIVNVDLNNQLPPNLSGCDYSKDFGFKGLEIAMASYMSELDMLTSPVTRHVLSAEMGNQSVNSLALLSARWTEQAVTVLQQMIANLFVCQAQAIDLRWSQRRILGILKKVCQKHGVDAASIQPVLWPWYDFLFTPQNTATKFIQTVRGGEEIAAFVSDLTCLMNEFMSDLTAGAHVQHVEQSLGTGTRQVYAWLRTTLGVSFYHGQGPLDTHLEKVFNAIVDRAVEDPLLNVFT